MDAVKTLWFDEIEFNTKLESLAKEKQCQWGARSQNE